MQDFDEEEKYKIVYVQEREILQYDFISRDVM